jgi:hypothetical protein
MPHIPGHWFQAGEVARVGELIQGNDLLDARSLLSSPGAEQKVHEIGPDESGPASNKNAHSPSSPGFP